VRYEDVRSYRITTGLSRLNREEPASSSHITLQNGPKIRFDLNTKYYEDEIDDFIAFTERVVDDMAAFEQPEEQPNIHQGVSKGTKAEGATSHFNDDHKKEVTDEKRSNLQRDHRDAKASLAKAKDRRRNKAKYAIPVSLAIGLLFLARACGPEIVDTFRDDTVADLRNSIVDRFDRQTNRVRTDIAKEGAVFLFTNDTTAHAQLYPNVERSANVGVRMLQKSNLAANIDEFLQHKDSLGFRTMIVRNDTVLIQSSRYPSSQTKGTKQLYFTVFDSQGQYVDKMTVRSDTRRLAINWAVSYRRITGLQDSVKQGGMSLQRFSDLFKIVPSLKLYVTASESEGASEGEFRKAVEQIKSMLAQHGLDTTSFKTMVHRPEEK